MPINFSTLTGEKENGSDSWIKQTNKNNPTVRCMSFRVGGMLSRRNLSSLLWHRLEFRTPQLLGSAGLQAWFGAVAFWFYQRHIPAHLSGSEVTVQLVKTRSLFLLLKENLWRGKLSLQRHGEARRVSVLRIQATCGKGLRWRKWVQRKAEGVPNRQLGIRAVSLCIVWNYWCRYLIQRQSRQQTLLLIKPLVKFWWRWILKAFHIYGGKIKNVT